MTQTAVTKMNENEERFTIIITNIECVKKIIKRLAEITTEAAELLDELSLCSTEEKSTDEQTLNNGGHLGCLTK